MRNQVQSVVGSQTVGLQAKLADKGWVWAGGYYLEMLRMKDAVKTASRSQMWAEPGIGAAAFNGGAVLSQGEIGNAVESGMNQYMYTLAAVEQQIRGISRESTSSKNPLVAPALTAPVTEDDFKASDGGASVKNTIKRYLSALPMQIVASVTNTIKTDTAVDPVFQIKNIGDSLILFGEGAWAFKTPILAIGKGVVAGASSSLLPGSSLLAGAAEAVVSFIEQTWDQIKLALGGIIFAGYFLAYYLPMIPFIIFALGVVGWLIVVIEAVVASALWAVMHITPSQDGSFIGGQQQGYLLLMSVFFRPALMVVGLVAAIAVTLPAMSFINAGFLMTFRSLQADSVTGIVGIAGAVAIYSFLVTSVMLNIFGLSQSLPDRILRWINAGIGDLGEQDSLRRVQGGASGQARAAMVGALRLNGKPGNSGKPAESTTARISLSSAGIADSGGI
jgi:conjugal transfer/type IV secretion protein DotA/TraY